MSRELKRGYTLIEALVSVALIAIGIVAVLGAYGSLTIGQRRVRDVEIMQRLGLDKYDEILATDSLQASSLSGDFSEYGEERFVWSANVEPTGVENLVAVTLTVEARDNANTQPKQIITGTAFQRPETTDTGGATP